VNDPAIISSAVATLIVVALALARLVYRLGKLSTQVEHLRHDAQRRHDAHMLQSLERHEGIVHRLERLETYFSTGRVGHGD
jgi:hypothetical protein